MGAKMWLPDNDPFEPTAAERSEALGWIAMVLAALLTAMASAVLFNFDSREIWVWGMVGAICLVSSGPKGIAYTRNFIRWLRRM
jgi:hypothetical protein